MARQPRKRDAQQRHLVWSYGGGVQSAAIAVLIREGALPVPDLTVIADTGRERRTTWQYMRDVIQPYLEPTGVQIQVAPHTLATVDLYAKTGRLLVPAYDGHQGRLSTYCSGEWKRAVVERWLRLQGVQQCDCWIGYSIDEERRIKEDHRQWCHYTHPLIEKRIDRAMCFTLCEKAGLPRPPKSRCWGCPHQTDEEWADVQTDTEEWEAAKNLDRRIREADERDGLYLYSGRVPLEMADFGAKKGMTAPVKPCESGFCWT